MIASSSLQFGSSRADQSYSEFNPSEPTFEQSFERDSRWKPHLSWSYLSWKLQQRMEEQAVERELAWQRIADKLGPLIISSDGGLTFGRNDYASPEEANDRAQERTPFYTQKLSYTNINYCANNDSNQQQNHQHNKQQLSSIYIDSSHATTKRLSATNSATTYKTKEDLKHDKARRRCMTVSGILIALIFLLFTLVILMALGILHR